MENNLKNKLAKVIRDLEIEKLTNELFVKNIVAVDENVENAVRDKMLTLTKMNTIVGDIENRAYAINDKELVWNCEVIHCKILMEIEMLRCKYNL